MKGRTIALAEGRQLEELAALLEAEGAVPLRCPLLSILDAPEAAPVEAWLRDLIAGRFDLVVLMTGEAVRRLHGFAARAGLEAEFVAALGRTPTLTRGPKPARALKELGLAPTQAAAVPTTEGVLAALRGHALAGKTLGATLYAVENPALEAFVREALAHYRPVLSYVYASSADESQVAELIEKLAAGSVDALIITSSPQVDRLYEVAQQRGLQEALARGWERTCVAAVGPIAAQRLREQGAPVHLCPEQGWVMKNLVRQLAKRFAGCA